MTVSDFPAGPSSWVGRGAFGFQFSGETAAGDLLATKTAEGEAGAQTRDSFLLARGTAAELDDERALLEVLANNERLFFLPRVVGRLSDAALGELLVLRLSHQGASSEPRELHQARASDRRGFVQLLRAMLEIGECLGHQGLDPLPHLGDFAVEGHLFSVRRLRSRARPDDEATPPRELLAQVASHGSEALLAALMMPIMHAVLPCSLSQADEYDGSSLRALLERALSDEKLTGDDTLVFGEGSVTSGICDRGLHRARNEDAVEITIGLGYGVLVTCDGVSASLRAALASTLAAHTARAWIEASAPSRAPKALVAQAIRKSHAALCDGHPDPMGTTIVAALVQGDQVTVGWVGDSRAYYLTNDGKSRQVSFDHSWLREVVAANIMPLEEALQSPHAHALTRCLGPLPGGDPMLAAEPDVITFTAERPGALMLCTDGLWNYFQDEHELAAVAFGRSTASGRVSEAPPAPGFKAYAIADRLVRAALVRGGHDNVSVVVRVFESEA